jgi:hypothetical protein
LQRAILESNRAVKANPTSKPPKMSPRCSYFQQDEFEDEALQKAIYESTHAATPTRTAKSMATVPKKHEHHDWLRMTSLRDVRQSYLLAEVVLMSTLLLLTCLINRSVMMTCLQSISEHDKKADDDDSDDEYRKKKTKKGDVAYAEYLASMDPTLKPPPPPPDDTDAVKSLASEETDRKPAAIVSSMLHIACIP